MMERKEIIRKILIIVCVFILTVIPWASVIGIQDLILLERVGIVQRSAGVIIVTAMVLQLIYQTYGKPLSQEITEEKNKEAEQKDEKQLFFKPTIGVSFFFIFFIFIAAFSIYSEFINNKVDLGSTTGGIAMMVFFTWWWYTIPTFTFTDDSVHIKSYLFYLIGIDRKTVISYADITSVSPDEQYKQNRFGLDRRYRMVISSNGTATVFTMPFYNSDIIAKIYLRFKENVGDKVKMD